MKELPPEAPRLPSAVEAELVVALYLGATLLLACVTGRTVLVSPTPFVSPAVSDLPLLSATAELLQPQAALATPGCLPPPSLQRARDPS